MFVGQSVGNIIGPLLYTQKEAPRYTRGLRSNLALYVVIMILCGLTTFYLMYLNKSHANRRVAMGKSAVIVDTSLDTAEEAAARQAAAEGQGDAPETTPGDRAFDNATDLENEDFVFVY